LALGLTQVLTEMNTTNLSGVKGRPARKANDLTSICEPIVWKMWEPRRLTTVWAFTPYYRDSCTFKIMLVNLSRFIFFLSFPHFLNDLVPPIEFEPLIPTLAKNNFLALKVFER
jgi:hypothetical protein